LSGRGWYRTAQNWLWAVTHPRKANLVMWFGLASISSLQIDIKPLMKQRSEKAKEYDAQRAARWKAKHLRKCKAKADKYQRRASRLRHHIEVLEGDK
jgi:hypothetical protein